MRMSQYYMPTLREVPAEAETPSHQLLLRAGMIRKAASGIYSFLPLGQRVLLKIERIVREEMDRAGSQEILTSALQPQELWEASGRWKTFGPEMFRLTDRHERGFCLGPTAEESFVDLVKGELRSYKQLPLNLYQIQWKYRDEKRPRFGINRSREFLMKDAYSFDMDEAGMREAYRVMWEAYERVFDRLHLDYRVVRGDSGAMGGHESHEFCALSEVGEGVIAYCEACDYAATDEKAAAMRAPAASEEPLPMEKVDTPEQRTIEEVATYLQKSPDRLLKTVCLRVDGEPVFVFLPGNRELNLAKFCAHAGVPEHLVEMLEDAVITELTGAQPGFIGPVGLPKTLHCIVDRAVVEGSNWICGANENGIHLKNVNFERDFTAEIAEDLWMIAEGDACPQCGAPLAFARGIEVGNIFQLGTKYSEALGASFLDENGKTQPFVMGSYGIGITRCISAVAEQYHDEKGLCWPMSVAPFEAIITVANFKNEEQGACAEQLYEKLREQGVDVLLDDRRERAGVKFADRDLLGIPVRLTVGKKVTEGQVEFSLRTDGNVEEMDLEAALQRVLLCCKVGERND